MTQEQAQDRLEAWAKFIEASMGEAPILRNYMATYSGKDAIRMAKALGPVRE